MAEKILVVAGPGAQRVGNNVSAAFEMETQSFLQKAFGVQRSFDLGRVLTPKPAGMAVEDLFCTSEQPQGANAGCVHILFDEAIAAGFEPSLAPLRSFFIDDGKGHYDVSPAWLPSLESASVVALSTSFIMSTREIYLQLDALRKRTDITVVVGGVLVNKLFYNANTFRVPKQFGADYLLCTEAEGRFRVVLSHIAGSASNEDLADIPGLLWKVNGHWNTSTAPFSNIDFNSWVTLPSRELVERNNGIQFYEAVRGCPFRCEFCDYPFLMGNKKARFKDADFIFEEWRALRDLGVHTIYAQDSLFTVPAKRLNRLCDLLIDSGLGRELKWHIFARSTELADGRVPDRLREAGCVSVFIGLESGSQRVLDKMNKRTTVEDNIEACKRCREADLLALAGIVIGFPGEDADSIRETVDMLNTAPPHVTELFPWLPDFNRATKVPAMQPERLNEWQIERTAKADPACLSLWGKTVPMDDGPAGAWTHASMNSREALQKTMEMVAGIYEGRIDSYDYNWFPASDLVRYPRDLANSLGSQEIVRFLTGLQDHYKRAMAGENGAELRGSVAAWMNDVGMSLADKGNVEQPQAIYSD